MKAPEELTKVEIPLPLAHREAVIARGTVVWSIKGASFVTVECECADDNPGSLRTKLLDVPVTQLKTV